MKWKAFFTLLAGLAAAQAADVNPSKQVQPEKFQNPNSARFNIFAGDPARIQKANQIDFSRVEGKLTLEPAKVTAAQAAASPNDRPTLKATFLVRNNNKGTITLSFPDAKRYDISVKNAAGQVIYVWSADKRFAQVADGSRINTGERDSYFVDLDLGRIHAPLTPGKYTVDAIMSNYPEITAQSEFVIE